VKTETINIEDYNYDLPEERIAQYPVKERDGSQLLICKQDRISKDIFSNIDKYIPSGSLLVFNNTRVIRARLLFRKDSGAAIEILCLEPLFPSEYSLSLGSTDDVEWKCIVGNLKKWKTGKLILSFLSNEKTYSLTAEKLCSEGEASRVRFSWNSTELSFGEVIDAAGHIPLPPYLNRKDEADDYVRYQTVYSTINGSVAAPTAGLHFTNQVFGKLEENKVISTEVTLHVGAGTFLPVKTKNIMEHEMHHEHFLITADNLQLIIKNLGKIIPVGTTSVRTLESLYWLGFMIKEKKLRIEDSLSLGQWDAYKFETALPAKNSLETLLEAMRTNNIQVLQASTSIIIIPGYEFRVINGLITNFHQPKSTLLLLISAWIGEKWQSVYHYALENNFRFLSYGDSSLLLR
jgi:S-adenosylmethionine:tRNA ribosyltransferase-isomerase